MVPKYLPAFAYTVSKIVLYGSPCWRLFLYWSNCWIVLIPLLPRYFSNCSSMSFFWTGVRFFYCLVTYDSRANNWMNWSLVSSPIDWSCCLTYEKSNAPYLPVTSSMPLDRALILLFFSPKVLNFPKTLSTDSSSG